MFHLPGAGSQSWVCGCCRGGKLLACLSVSPHPLLAWLGHDMGCNFHLDGGALVATEARREGPSHRWQSHPSDAAKPGCLARGTLYRRAARPPQRSWQAAGGSEDTGPAPPGSNYLPAASGPNPLNAAREEPARQTRLNQVKV